MYGLSHGRISLRAPPSKLERHAARHLVTQYLKVRSGENAIIESWNHTLPMATALLDEVRRVGGRALLIYNEEDAWWRAIDRKQSRLLGRSSAPEWAALQAADVYVNFWRPGDPDRIDRLPESADAAFDGNWPWYEVSRKTGLRGVRMTAGFAMEVRARAWGPELDPWQERFLRASLVDPDVLARSGARLGRALGRGSKVRITHPNGTDLEVARSGAAPRVQDGRPHSWTQGDSPYGRLTNLPAGSTDVVLDSRTAEGRFRANRRTNIWWSWHAGGTVEFSGGQLSSYSFQDGEEAFVRQYRRASAGKDRTRALTLGLNPAAREVPYPEKWERGCVSLQIGGNRGLGGSSGSGFVTWFSLAGAEISVDGTPVVRAGKIL